MLHAVVSTMTSSRGSFSRPVKLVLLMKSITYRRPRASWLLHRTGDSALWALMLHSWRCV